VPFTDEDFPPEFESLADADHDKAESVQKFKFPAQSWRRVSEIYPNAELFKQGVDSHDIN